LRGAADALGMSANGPPPKEEYVVVLLRVAPVVAAPHTWSAVLRAHYLEDWFAAGVLRQGPHHRGAKMSSFAFLTLVASVLEPRTIYGTGQRGHEQAGLEHHTFQGLRRDFGSILLEQGTPDKVAAEFMGHANPAAISRAKSRYSLVGIHPPDLLATPLAR
jgi:integrase